MVLLLVIAGAALAGLLVLLIMFARRAPLDDSRRQRYLNGEGYVSKPLPKERA